MLNYERSIGKIQGIGKFVCKGFLLVTSVIALTGAILNAINGVGDYI